MRSLEIIAVLIFVLNFKRLRREKPWAERVRFALCN
jgi:hypothetical protein